MNDHLNENYRELNTTKRHLLHSEKMASIGQLANGIAHEINNPVCFIGNNLAVFRKYSDQFSTALRAYQDLRQAVENDKAEEVVTYLEKISQQEETIDIPYIIEDTASLLKGSAEGIDRIKKIVHSLKEFSRVDDQKTMMADINTILDGVLDILTGELKYKIKLHRETEKLPLIACYPNQLGHVFVNILLNAVQAMSEGGKVTVKTELRKAEVGQPGVGRRKEDLFREGDEVVVVTVQDTGTGIPNGVKEKIFEPFFTTKGAGQGRLGLGLSICYDIIQNHAGLISMESPEGQGTQCVVTLPTALEKL